MRILMLGWEFPPFISGGLGTACHGLTRALDALGHEIVFVLPKSVGAHAASHVRLVSPEGAPREPSSSSTSEYTLEGFRSTRFRAVPAGLVSPYPSGAMSSAIPPPDIATAQVTHEILRELGIQGPGEGEFAGQVQAAGADYGGDVLGAARRYAHFVLHACRDEEHDVIHAHDWMTYPAGLALARVTGKPLVTHIHSTEFDRSGANVHQQVYDIERRGMHGAIRVIAVSELTRSIVVHRYGLAPEKVAVCYNGVDAASMSPIPESRVEASDKIVLFLGRITMQKGPEYFIAAARRVLEKMDNVKFLVAGNGDMARRMIELAAEMGIGHRVLFTGFLRGPDVTRVFKMADCYVMPSVSEPFGIAPLEALSQDTPVIISRQSGVAEVLTHALKVDFWDIDQMADKILAVLRRPPLRKELCEHGAMEVRSLTWEGAARRCCEVYEDAIDVLKELHAPSQATAP